MPYNNRPLKDAAYWDCNITVDDQHPFYTFGQIAMAKDRATITQFTGDLRLLFIAANFDRRALAHRVAQLEAELANR